MKQEHDLRLMFWNVRNLGDDVHVTDETERIKEIADIIQREDVDVACLAEVVGPDIKSKLNDVLPPGYTIFETASDNPHHLVTIFKNAANRSVMLTQRDEFKGKKALDRPYPLIEVSQNDKKVAILPMHAKAGTRKFDFKLRQFRLQDVSNLAATLNADDIPLIALGDMNTVGNGENIDPRDELKKAQYLLYDPTSEDAYKDWEAAKLILLDKDQPNTWKGIGKKKQRYGESDLDHVFISEDFKNAVGYVNDSGSQVRVGGWTDLTSEPDKEEWVRTRSDHGYLILDINMAPSSP